MADLKADLIKIVGKENVLDSPEALDSYATDQSFAREVKPTFAVKARKAEDIQQIVDLAKRTGTPLVPISSGPPHLHGDTVPSVAGAIIVDLSGMKKIISINRRNRIAIVEAGVTYTELQPALAKEGMRVSTSLLPRAQKSVITSLLEREPRLNCRYQWSSLDPLRCVEIVWGDGNKLWSGDAGYGVLDLEQQWTQERRQVASGGPGQTDFYRFLSAAQGSMGFVTWASLRCEVLPIVHKLFFVAANELSSMFDFTYQLLRFRYADELFIMNNTNLAYAMGSNFEECQALRDQLPPWIVIVGIAGRDELPEERVEFQQNDIEDIARQFSLEMVPTIPGATGEKVLKVITAPSVEPYWKNRYKGSCQDIFFVTTLDRTHDFIKTMNTEAEAFGYPVSDIGVYIQPRFQGVNCHCEFTLPYDPDVEQEVLRVQRLFTRSSESMLNQGAFFTRPYGIWADLAYQKDEHSAALLKKIKGIFDPLGVMNPGKLCF